MSRPTSTLRERLGLIVGATVLVSSGALSLNVVVANSPAGATVNPTAWSQLSPATSPNVVGPTVYDPANGQDILFGIDSSNSFVGTWDWNGTTWAQLAPATSPSLRSGEAMAYDVVLGEVILFGGNNPLSLSGGYKSDTWAWNGTTWAQLTTAHAPPGRAGAAMAYDPRSGQLVLTGGFAGYPQFGGQGNLTDTWTFNGTDWTQASTTEAPSGGSGESVAYDPASAQMVLTGGSDAVGTWLWTGGDWIPSGATLQPTCANRGSLTYDPGLESLVLAGGSCSAPGVWQWNGTGWASSSTTGQPTARSGPGLAYDDGSGQLVLFGGTSGATTLLDTWVLARSGGAPTWAELQSTGPFGSRTNPSVAFDPATDQLILFGGANPDPLGDTWTFDGASWSQLAPATDPPARADASMAFDPATGQLVLFGGEGVNGPLGDSWVWNGTDWTKVTTPSAPSARSGASMAFDPRTGRLLLFGGRKVSPSNDTWAWTGATWVKQAASTPNPPARSDAALFDDPVGGQLVLFGGAGKTTTLRDTWSWTGTSWSRLLPKTIPPATTGAAVATDPVAGYALLFGGNDGSTMSGTTWRWTGSNWAGLVSPLAPTARAGAGASFDPDTGNIVLVGGTSASGSDLSDAWAGPVTATTVATVSAGGPPSSPTFTVTGTNFGAEPPGLVPGCGGTGQDFTGLALSDLTHNWNAGGPGNCIGLNVSIWTSDLIVFTLGSQAAFYTLANNDKYRLTVFGATVTGRFASI